MEQKQEARHTSRFASNGAELIIVKSGEAND